MECYRIEGLTFKYPSSHKAALEDISLLVGRGEFITVCGQSGSGKSTLLSQLKPSLAPHGEKRGRIYFEGRDINSVSLREQSSGIGYVSQNPENQIVCDKVWHELAFGAESLGMRTEEIRIRVAETASFFGIQTWFHKNVNELSGGQKQLLNLASVMTLQPSVIILDEPTAMLDPISSRELIGMLSRINRELAVTVILTTHSPADTFELSDRLIVMEDGRIIADDKPLNAARLLMKKGNDMFSAMPAPLRIFGVLEPEEIPPVTVCEGRERLDAISKITPPDTERVKKRMPFLHDGIPVIEADEVFFRYERNSGDVLKGLSVKIHRGEFYAVMGGNGTGKTTALNVIGGLYEPHRGQIRINGRPLSEIKNLNGGVIGILPQDPQTLFVKKTVELELYEMLRDRKMPKEERDIKIKEILSLCGLETLKDRHPYDLSGGEQQRAALAKLLLLNPLILLLDEPTKGMDAYFKKRLWAILKSLKASGMTIIMVSHDIEFCAKYADRCAMFFDGGIVSEDEPHEFFSGKGFYTTEANRMARHVLPDAITAEEIISAFGGGAEDGEEEESNLTYIIQREEEIKKPDKKPNVLMGIISGLLFIAAFFLSLGDPGEKGKFAAQILSLLFLGICVNSFIPQLTLPGSSSDVQTPAGRRRLYKRTAIGAVIALVAVPFTIYFGIYFLGDRKYYFISLLIILETLIPFFMLFEKRKPQISEIVIISVLCAIAVAGRTAFGALPQFKPVVALVIISGICFGGETGFLVGAVTAFVSNFFFGQGPWTPWQMFSLGVIGFLAGVLFKKGLLRKTRGSLCIFGAFAAVVIYGGIMNPASVIMSQPHPNAEMLLASYAVGFPVDLIHAAATVFFLWVAAAPMTEKLERVKLKYGIISG